MWTFDRSHLTVAPADVVVALAAAALPVALAGGSESTALAGLEHRGCKFGLRTRKGVDFSSWKG